MKKHTSQGLRIFVLVQGVQGLKNHLLNVGENEFRVTVFNPKKHWALGNKANAVARNTTDNEVSLFIGNPEFVNEYSGQLKAKHPNIQIQEWKGTAFTKTNLQNIASECLIAVEA